MADRLIMIWQFSQSSDCSCLLLLPEFLLYFGEVLASLKPPKRDVWPAAHLFTSSQRTPACLGTRINTHRLLKGHWGDAHFGLLKRKKALNAVMESVWTVCESQGIGMLICTAWLWKNGPVLHIQINDSYNTVQFMSGCQVQSFLVDFNYFWHATRLSTGCILHTLDP